MSALQTDCQIDPPASNPPIGGFERTKPAQFLLGFKNETR
jgi:hypothetical protein